jgi:hypothetical protein
LPARRSCTGGKTEDFQAAAQLLHRAGGRVKVPTFLVPATQKVRLVMAPPQALHPCHGSSHPRLVIGAQAATWVRHSSCARERLTAALTALRRAAALAILNHTSTPCTLFLVQLARPTNSHPRRDARDAALQVWADVYGQPVPGCDGKTAAEIFTAAGCVPPASPSCAACLGGPKDTFARMNGAEICVSTTNRRAVSCAARQP